MTPEENFAQLGLILPPPPKPLGVYKPLLIDGKHCFVSGHDMALGEIAEQYGIPAELLAKILQKLAKAG